jgi:molybdopterin converting factor small subunit
MPVTFHIPAYLAAFAEGQRSLKLASSPTTVHDAFEALWRVHPGLRDRILDEQGEVRQHINIFVGQESIRFAGGLGTQVPDKSEILIVPAVSGGSGGKSSFVKTDSNAKLN